MNIIKNKPVIYSIKSLLKKVRKATCYDNYNYIVIKGDDYKKNHQMINKLKIDKTIGNYVIVYDDKDHSNALTSIEGLGLKMFVDCIMIKPEKR